MDNPAAPMLIPVLPMDNMAGLKGFIDEFPVYHCSIIENWSFPASK
jgi:hypothetical protein